MRSIVGFVIAICLCGVPASAQQVPPSPPAIVTHGDASIKRAPDQAWVSIAAETRAATSAEAQRTAAEAMKSVQSALAKVGLPADAIRTTAYSLNPDMEYVNGRGRVRGYIARNQIEVRVDDLTKISPVIDAAGSSGATSMSGLRFDLKDRATVEREALTAAVRDAVARARALASGGGVILGPILKIEDSAEVRPVLQYAMRSAAADREQTPISPGEVEISARVTVTFRIGAS